MHADAEEGLLAAVGVSYYKTGIYVGVIGGEILGAASPATIAIIDPKVTDVSFNVERAEMLETNIPATELADAGAVLIEKFEYELSEVVQDLRPDIGNLFAMAIIGIVMVNYFWQEEKMVIRGD